MLTLITIGFEGHYDDLHRLYLKGLSKQTIEKFISTFLPKHLHTKLGQYLGLKITKKDNIKKKVDVLFKKKQQVTKLFINLSIIYDWLFIRKIKVSYFYEIIPYPAELIFHLAETIYGCDHLMKVTTAVIYGDRIPKVDSVNSKNITIIEDNNIQKVIQELYLKMVPGMDTEILEGMSAEELLMMHDLIYINCMGRDISFDLIMSYILNDDQIDYCKSPAGILLLERDFESMASMLGGK
jgi:hypothetical protein